MNTHPTMEFFSLVICGIFEMVRGETISLHEPSLNATACLAFRFLNRRYFVVVWVLKKECNQLQDKQVWIPTDLYSYDLSFFYLLFQVSQQSRQVGFFLLLYMKVSPKTFRKHYAREELQMLKQPETQVLPLCVCIYAGKYTHIYEISIISKVRPILFQLYLLKALKCSTGNMNFSATALTNTYSFFCSLGDA